MKIDDQGLLVPGRFVASPNCDDRPPGTVIDLIVIHAISLPPGEFGGSAVEAFFTNRLDPGVHPYFETIQHLRVSAHFFVRREGGITQFVSCDRRAWHAGQSSWQGRERCNDFSIGIELEGWDAQPFEEAQYRILSALCRAIEGRYAIQSVAGHSDISPGRKTDPGPGFDWEKFHRLRTGKPLS